jgi:hypothetical protein
VGVGGAVEKCKGARGQPGKEQNEGHTQASEAVESVEEMQVCEERRPAFRKKTT